MYYWSEIQTKYTGQGSFKEIAERDLKFQMSVQVFKIKKGVLQKENCNICTIYPCLVFQVHCRVVSADGLNYFNFLVYVVIFADPPGLLLNVSVK